MESVPLGIRIREARVAAGLTQQALAFNAGIALRTLSLIENGEDTKLSTLRSIARVLDIPLTDLLGDDVPRRVTVLPVSTGYQQMELFELTDAVRVTANRIADGEVVNAEDKLDLAEQIWEVRRRMPAKQEYGAWWRSTGIQYSRYWRAVLLKAGERISTDGRPDVRPPNNGGEFSIERFAETGKGWITTSDTFETEHTGQEAWYTPPWVFEGLDLTFDLDVAAPPGGVPWIPARRYFTADDDGLAQEWTGIVWCNPPYSAPTEWCRRFTAHDEMALLIRADLSTGGPLTALAAADALWAPHGRLQFIDGEGNRDSAITFSTVLLGRGVAVTEAMHRLAAISGVTRSLT